MARTPEGDLKSRCRKLMRFDKDIYYCDVEGGSFSREGDPDMILCIKGRFIAMEFKSPIGSLEESQKIVRRMIQERGLGEYHIVRSLDQFIEIISRAKVRKVESVEEE